LIIYLVDGDVGLEGLITGATCVDTGLATDGTGVLPRVELIPSVVAARAKEFISAKKKLKAFCLVSAGCGADA
jgi:hypothetical protein